MYESCVEEIARSIGMNCASPLVGGYTGRGVAIPWGKVQSVTQNDDNPRKVLSIALASGATVCAIDNASMTTPFEGSNTAGNNDAGFVQFVKVVSGRILERGAQVSKDLVEPLVKSAEGFLIILEKQDKVGDGSYEIVGLKSPARCVDPSTVVRNENENGGSITFSLQSSEQWFEVTLNPTPRDGQSEWSAAKQAFDALYEQGI